MGKNRGKAVTVVRWVTRVLGLGMVGLFILFFIGEGGFGDVAKLTSSEKVLMIFIPVVFIAGMIVTLFRELWGGIIIILSVVGFNTVNVIASKSLSGGLEFWYLLIPGIIFIVLYCVTKKKMNHSNTLIERERL